MERAIGDAASRQDIAGTDSGPGSLVVTTRLTAMGSMGILLVVTLAAYHRGRRQGRVTLPPDLVAELRGHKTRCIGEPPERVALEIRLLCDTDSRPVR